MNGKAVGDGQRAWQQRVEALIDDIYEAAVKPETPRANMTCVTYP